MKKIAERTGEAELNISYFEDRLGSMATSTRCCATGTCASYTNPDISAPKIVSDVDAVDAEKLWQEFGSIIQ